MTDQDVDRLRSLITEESTRVCGEITSLQGEVEQLRRALFGNGDIGLTERIRILERLAESVTKVRIWVVAGVGGLLLKLAFDAFTWYARQ